MGQYFKAAIRTSHCDGFSIKSIGFAKFTEWSYVQNSRMMAIMEFLEELSKDGQIEYTHAGDYSEKDGGYKLASRDDVDAKISTRADEIDKLLSCDDSAKTLIEQHRQYFLYNESKKEMLEVARYIDKGNNTENDEDSSWAISPLAILCCTEMPLGGGDYCGFVAGQQLIDGGRWLGDEISITKKRLAGYKDITSELHLSDSEDDYDNYLIDCSKNFSASWSGFQNFMVGKLSQMEQGA